jgi:hypothetical protein
VLPFLSWKLEFYDWFADIVVVLLFLLDGAELSIVSETAQPAAVHCGYPTGEVYNPMFSLIELRLPLVESGREMTSCCG